MSLSSLVNNSITDKNTIHSYLNLYENLLKTKKETALNVIEIGIWMGGSIQLWHDYFVNASIYAVDVLNEQGIPSFLKNNSRIKIHHSTNAYDINYINSLKHIKFDMILDDGPHTLDTMKTFVKNYSYLLSDDGILILEDVQDIMWIEPLKQCVPDDLKQCIDVYDLRTIKGRYDDIVFVVNKSKLK